MRMRRKKHLDDRMDGCADRVINMKPADLRFGADTTAATLDLAALFGNDHPVELRSAAAKADLSARWRRGTRSGTLWRWRNTAMCW